MTLFLSSGIAGVLFAMAVMQSVFVWIYCRILLTDFFDVPTKKSGTTTVLVAVGEEDFVGPPAVAVVLCLRGADPSLLDCLTGISAQEYPNYQLHIVVDDIHDPALEILAEFFHGDKQPPIHVIQDVTGNCSLKCAALIEAVGSVPDSFEILAFLDADTVPDQQWLSELVAPLSDPEVGATTGNRWFAPLKPSLGGYVRQLWNAAAVVQMQVYNIAWGGTLAMKRSTLAEINLPDKWSQAFCEDTMVSTVFKKHKLKLVRLPGLVCENTESTTVPDAFQWIVRQLVTVRLYHPSWTWVQLHGLVTWVGSLIAPVAVIVFFVLNDGKPFYITAAAFLLYQGLNLALLLLIEWLNLRAIDRRQGFNRQDRIPTNMPMRLLALVLVQFVHPWACFTASVVRTIKWRGIDYKIGVRQKITLKEYLPYREIGAEVAVDGTPEQSIS